MAEKLFVTVGVPEITFEDSGRSMIATVYGEVDEEVFVRIQSWSEADEPIHPIYSQVSGKRLRVTVEVVELAD